MLYHKIRYKLQRMLGPVKMPSQKVTLPSLGRLRNHFVLLSLTNCKHATSASRTSQQKAKTGLTYRQLAHLQK